MRTSGVRYAVGSASPLENTARSCKLSAVSLTQWTRRASTAARWPSVTWMRHQTALGFLRANCVSFNGVSSEAFSSVATPNAVEESETEEKEALEHLVRSVDSASESEIDDPASEAEADEDLLQVQADKTDESLLLKNCGLSSDTLAALAKRNITALFPIQKHVFDPAMKGRDLIGRAKTGSGKTLAFAIPVVENLLKEDKQSGNRKSSRRSPRAIVITPTRELANQVCREFQSICPALSVKSFYGGVSRMTNFEDLKKGVDVAVGTPGRLIDLAEQRALDLSAIRFAILDESDQMLDMGFEEDMEKILAYTPKEKQTMLFSATLPAWVRKVARKYLSNQLIVDLLGDEGTGKISDTIKALGILVQSDSKRKMLGDLLSTYAAGKQSIVFTQTKREADVVYAVAGKVVSSAVLHGDIGQSSREMTLARFRNGQFSCLVATDVAARGLDIPSVDLVVHYDCPQTHESFVHRSGRTGRAGKQGTTLVMVTKPEVASFHKIIRASQTDIEMIGPPNPRDVMQASTKGLLDKMVKVTPEVVEFFKPAAEKMLQQSDGSKVLAAALATMSGFTHVPQPRSLLTQKTGYVTIRILARPGRLNGFGQILHTLSELLDKEIKSQDIGSHELIEDRAAQKTGAMVDLPAAAAMQLLQNASVKNPKLNGIQVDRPKALSLDHIVANCPPERATNRGNRFGGRSGFRSPRGNRSRGGGGNRFGNQRDRWNDFGYGDNDDGSSFPRRGRSFTDRTSRFRQQSDDDDDFDDDVDVDSFYSRGESSHDRRSKFNRSNRSRFGDRNSGGRGRPSRRVHADNFDW